MKGSTKSATRFFPKVHHLLRERNAEIERLYANTTMTLAEIGKRYHISAARVCQICNGRVKQRYG